MNKADPRTARIINTADDLPDNCIVSEVAQFFRQTDGTIRSWIRDGKFPNAFRGGKIFLVPKQDVLDLAQQKYGKR